MKNIRKALCILLTMILMVSSMNLAMADDDIRVKIDGEQITFDVQPQLINDRTMVPLRAIFEALGATVSWDGATQTVTAYNEEYFVKATINNKIMIVNGVSKSMDIAPMLINERTLVPARFVAEAFGCDVEWDAETKTVIISNKEKTVSIPEYITDFSVEYSKEYDIYKVFFGFKDSNNQYVTYNGTAKINIENEDGENVYSGEFTVNESMFGTYTRKTTGNEQYILCKINIPVSEIEKGKKEKGTLMLDFYNSYVTCGQMKQTCYNLPLLTGSDLAQISYDDSFTLWKKDAVGWVQTDIDTFEITDIEIGYSGDLKVTYKIIGTVKGDDYCDFAVKCYDADGFVIGTVEIFNKVSNGETFKITDTIYIPEDTVRIEFVAD